MLAVFGWSAAAVAAGMVTLWLLSVALADVSIVDVYWGLGFAMIAWVTACSAPRRSPRAVLVLALVSLWALRLALHLFLRWRRAAGEDRRYAAMRRKAGVRFVRRSLITVFGLQGVLMWVVSLPL